MYRQKKNMYLHYTKEKYEIASMLETEFLIFTNFKGWSAQKKYTTNT